MQSKWLLHVLKKYGDMSLIKVQRKSNSRKLKKHIRKFDRMIEVK